MTHIYIQLYIYNYTYIHNKLGYHWFRWWRVACSFSASLYLKQCWVIWLHRTNSSGRRIEIQQITLNKYIWKKLWAILSRESVLNGKDYVALRRRYHADDFNNFKIWLLKLDGGGIMQVNDQPIRNMGPVKHGTCKTNMPELFSILNFVTIVPTNA